MKSKVASIILLLGLSGCARMFNESTTAIKIYSNKPAKLSVDGKEYWVNKKVKIRVARNDSVLTVEASSDSTKKVYRLKPIYSFNYYANIFTYGLGFIWDTNKKKYTYHRNIYIDFNSTSAKSDRFSPFQNGSTYWRLSFPWVNSFYLKPLGQPSKTNTGFWGFSLGIDHYYRPHKFINGTVSGNMDLYIPIIANIDMYGDYELMSSEYGSISDNFQFKNFSMGYGISYSKNTWLYSTDKTITPISSPSVTTSLSSESLGLVLNGYYRCSEHFSVGVIYRPNLFTIKPLTEFTYEHLFSIDLSWKFLVSKGHSN